MLCRTPDKDARQEILRRCAGGGGTFEKTGGGKIALPATNLNDVANQADDLIVVCPQMVVYLAKYGSFRSPNLQTELSQNCCDFP
jgi:hypothetical protein